MKQFERRLIKAHIPTDYLLEGPQSAKHLYILLHGYDDKPSRLWRYVRPMLPPETLVLAPCGPFPLPHIDKDQINLRYGWYFYDIFEKTYHIDQKFPCEVIDNLLGDLRLDHLPCTIIGYSQGGYLSPFLGLHLKNTIRIVGINCEFRESILPAHLPFVLDAYNAKGDKIVNPLHAQSHHEALIKKGNQGSFTLIEGEHALTQELVAQMAFIQGN